jgi:cell division septum initiation protein DivIVA
MDKAIQDLGRKIAIRNRRQKARQAIDDEVAQIILSGKRDNLVLSDIAKRLNSVGKKTSTGKEFGNVQVFRALKMLEADGVNDDVEDSVNGGVTEQVDIEDEILRSKLVVQLKAENAELKAERDKVNQTLVEFSNSNNELAMLTTELQEQVANLTKQLETSQNATQRLRKENKELLAELQLAKANDVTSDVTDGRVLEVLEYFKGQMKDTRYWTKFKKFVEELERRNAL